MELSHDFWGRRRVLVTGSSGFKGSWLSLWLQEMDAELTGVERGQAAASSLFETAGVGRGMHKIAGDVTDPTALRAALREARPEVVFHLAAQPIVSRARRDPVSTFRANVMGTVGLLEAVRSVQGVRAVVVVSTYGPGRGEPYGASKACAELVSAAYGRSYFEAGSPGVATARSGNLVGGGDWGEDRLVPDLMRAALGGAPARLRRPQARRSWQHVLDALGGYLVLAEALYREGGAWSGTWDFVPDRGRACSVARMAERLEELWGEPVPVELGDGATGRHGGREPASPPVRALPGWMPGWDLDRALAATVEWYRGYREGVDLRQLMLAQIRSHPAARALAAAV